MVLVLFCWGDSFEEDLRWGPRLGAFVDLAEFADDETNDGTALFKTAEAFSGAFFFSISVELKNKGRRGRGSWPWNYKLKHVLAFDIDPLVFLAVSAICLERSDLTWITKKKEQFCKLTIWWKCSHTNECFPIAEVLKSECSFNRNSRHLSAVGKHLFECEHFHHIVNLHNISVYSELEPSFIETHYHISAAISENTKIIDRNNKWTQLCYLESFYIKRLAPALNIGIKATKKLNFFK